MTSDKAAEREDWLAAEAFRPDAVAPETAALNQWLEQALAGRPATHEVPPDVTRAARAEGRSIFPNQMPSPACRWIDIGAAPGGPGRARLSEPDGAAVGTYLHIHGGGWTLGAADQADHANLAMAKASGFRVISVAYRLAPEHPWPACADDCAAAARWAVRESRGPLAIGGESAGAHLAAVTLLRLREEGLAGRFDGAVLNYGAFDLTMTPSMRNWGARNLVLSTPMVDWFIGNLLPDAELRASPEASPLRAGLSGLPPAWFSVGTLDPLLDDTLFMAARWRAAGNHAELSVWPGGVHAFDYFDLPMAQAAQARQAAFLASLA